MNKKPSIFLSYNQEQNEYADKLERLLNNFSNIVRDTGVLPWNSLTEFMKTIRKQDFAILMISDEYLKSVNCMFEVSQLMKDEDWKNKVMFIVFPNTRVYDTLEHKQYISYWQNKREAVENQINTLPKQSVEKLINELKKIDEIQINISSFLACVQDLKNPDYNIAVKQISKRMTRYVFDECKDFYMLFKQCIEQLCRITNTDYNQIILSAKIDSHSTGLVVFADKIAPGKQKYRIVEQSGLIASCYATGRTINCGNIRENEDYFVAVRETASEIVIPIISANHIIGVFNSESDIPNYYSDEMVMEIEVVCSNFTYYLTTLEYKTNMYYKLLPYISL